MEVKEERKVEPQTKEQKRAARATLILDEILADVADEVNSQDKMEEEEETSKTAEPDDQKPEECDAFSPILLAFPFIFPLFLCLYIVLFQRKSPENALSFSPEKGERRAVRATLIVDDIIKELEAGLNQ